MKSALYAVMIAIIVAFVAIVSTFGQADAGILDSESNSEFSLGEGQDDSRIAEDLEINENIQFKGSLEILDDVIVVIREGATVTISGDAVSKGTLIVGQGAMLKVLGTFDNRGLFTVTGSGSHKAHVTVTGSFVNSSAMHIDELGVLKGNIVAAKGSVTSISGKVDGDVYSSGVVEVRGSVNGGIIMESEGSMVRICGTSADIDVLSSSPSQSSPAVSINPSVGHSVSGLVIAYVENGEDIRFDLSGQVSSSPVSLNDRQRSVITCSGDCVISDELILERGTDLVVSGCMDVDGILEAMYSETDLKVSGTMDVTGVVDSFNKISGSGKLNAERTVIEGNNGDFYRYVEKSGSRGLNIDIGIDTILIAAIIIVIAMIVVLLLTDPRFQRNEAIPETVDDPSEEVEEED